MLKARRSENVAPRARPRRAARQTVASIMTREVVATTPDCAIESAIAQMLHEGIQRLPVVDDDGRLLGVFSISDYAVAQAAAGDTRELEQDRPARKDGAYEPFPGHVHEVGLTVAERMGTSPVVVAPSTPIASACELMSIHHVHGLPVVENQRLVGIVSALDVAAWVAGLRT